MIFCPEGDELLSPAEVLALLPSGLVLHNIGSRVVKIRDDLVVKYGFGVFATEVHSMNFVRKHTNILVPRVHLAFLRNNELYIVMQYIEGATLEARWNMMDDNTRTATLLQLSGYLRQLRALENPSSSPGPLDQTACRGRWFSIYNAGPFQTHADLVKWLNHKMEIAPGSAEPFTDNYRLVFTHQDLAPRNLLVDEANQLWMIDWEFSGWYPAYFEYACVASLVQPIPQDWISEVLAFLDSYGREYNSLRAIQWALEFTPFA
jgi:thiamine kinase-like enzyme